MAQGWQYSVMAAAAVAALLVACSGDSGGHPASTSEATSTATVQDATPSGTFATNTAEASVTAATTSTTEATPSETTAAVTKVSANSASRSEIAAALEAAGVANADRWAREVEEYRPYPEDDPDMAKLRQELAKYNPADGVVDAIVGALSLP